MERIIQMAIVNALDGTRSEVSLREVGAISIGGNENGRMDVVHERLGRRHGIELKVVCMPRQNSRPSNALYDVGQLTADYWRISNATGLDSGELLILLHGFLVSGLQREAAICRELHNRLYVDFQTSIHFSELRDEAERLDRRRQIAVAKEMGVSLPCSRSYWRACVNNEYAIVSIPVVRGVMPRR